MHKFKTLVMGMVTLVLSENTAAAEAIKVSQGVNQLGERILTHILKVDPERNVFISAYSLHEALTMLHSGAQGSTRKELSELLGLDNLASSEAIAENWKNVNKDLMSADPKVRFEIANSLWANQGLKVKFLKTFVSLNRNAHQAEVRDDLDFQSPNFVPALNGWVSKKTHGKITEIIEPPVARDQLFYLINAVYFKGNWKLKFDPKKSKAAKFTLPNQSTVDMTLMTQSDEYDYFENQEWQAVRLPFGVNGRFDMVIFLPKAKLDVNFKSISEARSGLVSRSGTVEIPRFTLSYENTKIIKLLQAMGVKESFLPTADFSKMLERERARVEPIIHRAVLEVTEEGAEAAAVTAIGGPRGAAPAPPFHFLANRPFYFEIGDRGSATTLFSGVLSDPS